MPTDTDLAFARNAASDVLTKGDKDASQPWENPETGARGSVTPLAQAYSSEGRTCRDFLASYVNGRSESWLQGAACKTGPRRMGNSYAETLETGLGVRAGTRSKLLKARMILFNKSFTLWIRRCFPLQKCH